MRYKPSAANLQENPQRGWGRRRSVTGSEASGGESLRSRGDLWPSEDEDDAVVIGDDAFPRSSDGESLGVELLGEEVGEENVEEEEEGLERKGKKKRRKGKRAETMGAQGRGGEGYGAERSKDVPVYPTGRSHRSAPPTIVASSPEPYMTERMGTAPFTISQTRTHRKQYSKSLANTIASDKEDDLLLATSPQSLPPNFEGFER